MKLSVARSSGTWKRLATSLVLAGREIGVKKADCEEAVHHLIARYRKYVDMFARMPVIDMVRFQVHRLQRIAPVSTALLKAERSTPVHTLEQLTVQAKEKSGQQRSASSKSRSRCSRAFHPRKHVLYCLHCMNTQRTLLPERRHFFAQYHPVDVGFKVVGTGSVGLRDYLVYFEGNGRVIRCFCKLKKNLLQAYAKYLDSHGPHHQGQRVAEASEPCSSKI